MTITDADRHRLYDALVATLGEQEAAILMEHLPPVGWADVATKTDLEHLRAATKTDLEHLRAATKADIDGLRVQFDGLRAEMNSGFVATRAAMDAQAALLRAEMATGFASQLRWIIGTIIASYAVIAALGFWR